MVHFLRRRRRRLLALSTSLSLLLSHGISVAAANPTDTWPRNLPAHARYWPDEPPPSGTDAPSPALEPQRPCRVRKMSGDEGEKFYMEYWQLGYGGEQQQPMMEPPDEDATHHRREGPDASSTNLRPRSTAEEDGTLSANDSMAMPYRPAFLVHADQQLSFNAHFKRGLSMLLPRAGGLPNALQRREFRCPTGTESCSAIGRPNSCCGQGETCQLIQDTGLGDVGCCSASRGCTGQVRNCDVGFTGCAGEIGGGCCIPRYVCVAEGCAPGPELTALVVVTPTVTMTLSAQAVPTSRSLSTSISFPSSTSSSELVIPTSTVVSTFTTTASTTIELTTSSPPPPPSTSTTTTTEPPPSTSTTTTVEAPSSPSTQASPTPEVPLIAPVRPTSGAGSPSTVTGTDTITETTCPTGFYQCAAVYRGGCCRVGRNCDSTSCPPTALTTLQTSNGVTVIVPAGLPSGSGANDADEPKITAAENTGASDSAAAGPSTTTTTAGSSGGGGGSCATGWYSCAASASGGCCPSGYACAISDCQVTATGVPGLSAGSNVGKLAPSSGAASPCGTRSWSLAWSCVVSTGVLLLLLTCL